MIGSIPWLARTRGHLQVTGFVTIIVALDGIIQNIILRIIECYENTYVEGS